MKTYVLCTALDEQSISNMKKVKNVLDLKNATVHIVTVVEVKLYNLDLFPYTYPAENQYPAIESAAIDLLAPLATSLGLEKKDVVLKCFFSNSSEEKIKNYLDEVNADLVVTATRGKHGIKGLFSGSFTDFLCKFSPCDVLVMRPSKI
jgi:nucleotide-binding universal stress UspA family protein